MNKTIIQKSPVMPRMGVYFVFMLKMEEKSIKGKVINAISVSIFITLLVLSVRIESFVF
jgi:hypothetical protein